MTDQEDPRHYRREDFTVLREVPLRWADQDMYGHVNNAIHYLVMDTAINGWLIEASGVDIRQLPALGLVIETNCRYLAEINFPLNIVVGIMLENSGRTSVRYILGLFAEDVAPIAVARFVHVYVDRDTRRPTPIPAEIQRALRQLG